MACLVCKHYITGKQCL